MGFAIAGMGGRRDNRRTLNLAQRMGVSASTCQRGMGKGRRRLLRWRPKHARLVMQVMWASRTAAARGGVRPNLRRTPTGSWKHVLLQICRVFLRRRHGAGRTSHRSPRALFREEPGRYRRNVRRRAVSRPECAPHGLFQTLQVPFSPGPWEVRLFPSHGGGSSSSHERVVKAARPSEGSSRPPGRQVPG